MRLALLVAFVGSLLFSPMAADARPSKTTAASKQKAKTKKAAKRVKTAKAPRKAKIVEAETPVIEEDRPAAKEQAPARKSGGSVAQADDDEVPRNQPKSKR